jgi:hypothetical protein
VRCDVANVRYVPSGLHDSDPAFVLARKLTGCASPPRTGATLHVLKRLGAGGQIRDEARVGRPAKSRASTNGGVSNMPVATSFSSFVAGSMTRSSFESRSKASHFPSGESAACRRAAPVVSCVSLPVPKS